ncbi:MAG TPA: putative LPS assembly protein LptD [Ignavibacteria bacterium]|nr:putative LPS assembly protein LptD [Ignavibacteria bacterium]
MHRYLILIIFLSIVPELFSQEPTDSVLYVPINDSLIKKDTVKPTSDVDAIIDYSAKDSAIFDMTGDKLYLYGKGELKYKEYNLKAARIILYRETSVMEAHGVPDTAISGKYIGLPIFYEGAKRYDAFKLRYNFESRKGNIEMGSTEIEGGYYLGEKIKKVDEDTYFIKNGRYTTCDFTDPHFYFSSPRMKVMQGDKVVAEPVYLCVDDVPVFVIPFGIFPNHSGRSSGLIPPAYGEDPTYGRYLSHLGYFWAMNDFMDIAFQGNYYTKGRYDLSARYRYALRYKLSGSVDIGGSRIRLGEQNDIDKVFSDEWRIAVYHNQAIDPTTNLTANVNFLSSKNYYTNSTNNLTDLLSQNAISNVTLSKVWEGTPNSASINYSRDQNLTTGEVSQVIPSVSFFRTQSNPFRGKNTSLLDLKWYEQFAYNYSGRLLYRDNKVLKNPSQNNGDFNFDSRGGVQHLVTMNLPIKFSEFSFTPNFNYAEVWYNKSITKTFNSADSTVTTNEVKGFKSFRTFSTGATLNTRLVGIFNTRIFGIKGFRHTITPSVSYNYTPDFSKPSWNYYGSYINQFGTEIKYSFFEKEVFGSPSSGEQQSIGLNVGNVFEMKVKDTDSTDPKFQLLNASAGISYNFVADSLKFSELGLGFRTAVGQFLNIAGSASFNLYKYVDGIGRINKFLWKEERRLAQLTTFNINLSTTLQGGQDEQLTGQDSVNRYTEESEYVGIYGDKPADFSIPWSVTFSYNYGIDMRNPSVLTKFSNVSSNLGFNLTRYWKFTFSASYDIFQKQFAAPYVTIYRDLHCWELSFNWVPTGLYRGYRFELRIKAPQLQDVKINKQTNYRGVF